MWQNYLENGDGVGHNKVDAGELLEEHVGQGQQERLHYKSTTDGKSYKKHF
jgi:hypothetical protein